MPDKTGIMSGTGCCGGIANMVVMEYIAKMSMASPRASKRVLRTRTVILDAFVGLALNHRYDTIRIADLIAAAGIGKATFYEHFRSKNDVLLAAMEPVLLALSVAASGRAARSYVKGIVSHLWDRRSIGRTVLSSAAAPIMQRRLAGLIGLHIERAGSGDIAPSIKATGIAAAQIAMLRSWLAGEVTCTADEVTDELIRYSRLIA